MTLHNLLILGCFALALFALAQAFKMRRRDAQGRLVEKAEWMRREERRSKMQPRYTTPQKNTPRSLRRW